MNTGPGAKADNPGRSSALAPPSSPFPLHGSDGMRLLEDSIVRLLKDKPFYGQFLLLCRRRELSSSAPAGVTLANGVPTLAVNPQHFSLFSDAEQQALLEHLVRHLLHLHPARRRERHQRNWDLACDLTINPSIAGLPPEAPQQERLHLPAGLAAEEYYARLPQLALLGSQPGDGEGEGEGKTIHQARTAAQPIDDHSIWQQADRTPRPLCEQVVRQMVQTALRRCHQEIPGELHLLLKPFLTPPGIPWQQVLRQFVGTSGRIGRRSTWKRNHRRFDHNTPGARKRPMLNLLVAVDVSDSTDQQPLRERFAAELLHIARGRDSRLTILYSGSRIQKIDTFSGAPQTLEVFHGGGFTDLRPAFDYAGRMTPPPAAVIYLTDGFGSAPEHARFPTLWVLTSDGQKPADWGVELRLQPTED